jgi:ATP-dependent RNA helicase DDX46/PRP5
VDAAGVSITNKGVYYAPGTQPRRKDPAPLYLLVEGDTQDAVTRAVMVLNRPLREGMEAGEAAAANHGSGA